jgi:hypothetical protein
MLKARRHTQQTDANVHIIGIQHILAVAWHECNQTLHPRSTGVQGMRHVPLSL